MASTNIAFMPQDIAPPYFPDPHQRSNRQSLWSQAPPATPQTSTASNGTVWGSPLFASAKSSLRTSPDQVFQTLQKPNSLAALAADSEPVFASQAPMGSAFNAASQFSSRRSSQTEITPLSPNSILSLQRSNTASPVQSDLQERHREEIINTAIVVKNIPFAIKKEQLIDFMVQLQVPLPYAFNYHFDNGVFRGLAFANFANSEETSKVIKILNGKELGGRKLRVEYKKMLPFQERERIEREKRERRGQLEEQHAPKTRVKKREETTVEENVTGQMPAVDMNVLENLQMYTSLVLFKNDAKNEMHIPAAAYKSMTPSQVANLRVLCQHLDLEFVIFDGHVVVEKRSSQPESWQQPFMGWK